MAKSKYETAILIGQPLTEDASGKLFVAEGEKSHPWRIGKHTKGKLLGPGQVFLTEQNQKVRLAKVEPLSFKDRHDYQPMGRFTKEMLD
ncbi:hypothetical protein LQZ24_01910 [Fructobacillus sp. M1-13]|uniref:DUF7671 domain-containing protein n=1 Tax=Fructobacillus papyriferae TaxID=2713171 RepID=A0ABS5QNT1_9LACO|nr:hypothetical protein [Fructobacillus papyriferae]MBS9334794.1 hypothetical protein [Fructobacillus papyriferae]MCD2158784.1 hypothetical protein [Fructobacillus papyriferae]